MSQIALAIHGGAGTISKAKMSSEKENLYKRALSQALEAGYKILSHGGSSVDAVEASVKSMEDNELFNAGKGAVFTFNNTHEMDASIMCGRTLNAGAVAGVRSVKNPILLSRMVMERSDHVFLLGAGAEEFGREHNIDFEPEEYFFSLERKNQLEEAKRSSSVQLDHSDDKKFGTVGAVAIDQNGNLSAATSTGGMTNKRYGRIGDSPIIGAGNYANNKTCAVSCTGHGEIFIRATVAYDVSCLIEYKGLSLQQACDMVVLEKLKKMEGEGGLIAVDKEANLALVFNSEGMYRAWKKEGGTERMEIFKIKE
jgi:beta-aspartyl-peptidase (threonine type)